MNIKAVLKIIGFLLFLVGLFMLTGIPFSLYYGSDDILALLISGAGTSIIGLILWITNKIEQGDELTSREGYLIVSSGWILASLFGSLPFIIHGSIPNITNAIFESVSGFTTTGASILNNVESMPYGLLFWRSMTHWLGGMGIIVLSLAILPMLRIGGMSLYKAEVAGPSKDKLHPRVQETAKRLWAIYLLLTLTETILLMFGGMNLFDALCHSFGTLASGGFSTKNASIASYHSPFIEYVVIVFMFLAGTNFTLHYLALKGNPLSYFKDSEFRFYITLVILMVIGAALYLDFHNDQPLGLSFRNAAFSIISVLSSTGFVIGDYEKWAPFFSEIFLVLLLIGACAGSTSGGVKMVRYQVLLKNSVLELKRLLHPNAVIPVRLNKSAVPSDIISKIAAFVLLYLFIFLVGSILMAIIGLELSSSMGAVAACLGNIGPGLGSTGPANTYSNVPDLGKWVLTIIMLLGRLELYTILILFSPSFWKS